MAIQGQKCTLGSVPSPPQGMANSKRMNIVGKRSGKSRATSGRAAGKKKTRKTNAKQNVGRMLSNFDKLVMDPCHGPLVRAPGFSDGVGIVERQRATISLDAAQGYIVWFPSYQGAGAGVSFAPQNGLIFTPGATNVAPVNTTASPLGTAAATSGVWLDDPAYTQLAGSAFSRARGIAGCLQLEFLGALSSIKGQVALISNMTLANLNLAASGSLAGTLTLPTVDQMFRYAATRERLDLKGHEVRFRPTDLDCKLRGDSISYMGAQQTHGTVPDALFWSGTVGAVAATIATASPELATGIVIAWRSCTGIVGDLTCNMVKVSEYELAMNANLVEQPYKPAVPGVTIASTVDKLFKMMPEWPIGSVIKGMDAASRLLMASRTYAPGRGVRGTSYPAMIMDGEL